MQNEFETLNYEADGPMASITLIRPEKLNAIAMKGVHELHKIANQIMNDKNIRIVTIKGSGRAFSTGIDLKDLANGLIEDSYFDLWDRALRCFELMDKLVVCLIHGYAIGGGLQLALAADIRVSTASAKLGLPAIKEGLIPGLGTFRLSKYIGLGRAKRLIITGEMIDGMEGERIGLIDYIVSESEKNQQFHEIIDNIAAVNSNGCRLSKSLLNKCYELGFEQFFESYKDSQATAVHSEDFKEAMTAYKQNREPVWS